MENNNKNIYILVKTKNNIDLVGNIGGNLGGNLDTNLTIIGIFSSYDLASSHITPNLSNLNIKYKILGPYIIDQLATNPIFPFFPRVAPPKLNLNIIDNDTIPDYPILTDGKNKQFTFPDPFKKID
ncbi:hypothetical protein CPAV1605_146 [seawater metagenome]|uniref:Uncharacterized protein n=1 Tax=seawater metagenome TaxID=1561972 RepID=A0A5E8CIC1_9ZZZZ